ncbi:MAG: diaminopimelate decarboxylase [Gammaproteobacteria bacterium]|nr:diaminopimelate decarboxylase [Gammaproteobacteria bacterium]
MLNLELTDQLLNIAAKYGTPCYVYDKQQFLKNYDLYKTSFESYSNLCKYLICYAVKANSNLTVLNQLAKVGSGFDIVSVGELNRVLKAGGDSNKIVFSGVGKQDFEIKAALDADILSFNIESEAELILTNQIAKQLNKIAPISIRVNPNIDAKSHPYISTGLKEHKFGINIDNAEYIYQLASELSHIKITGIDCHIGSQLTDIRPLEQACLAINKLILQLLANNIIIKHINMGGGLGINYSSQYLELPSHKLWVDTIVQNINPEQKLHDLTIVIEPGRSIIGNAGLLLTTVIYNKVDNINDHSFVIVDAAMNDLMRPALYGAEHRIINLKDSESNISNISNISIVGPVCESSDVFLKNINLEACQGDILAILDTGAYGFTMSSNYNSRPRAAEVLIDNDQDFLIRKRETIEDLYNHEIIFY